MIRDLYLPCKISKIMLTHFRSHSEEGKYGSIFRTLSSNYDGSFSVEIVDNYRPFTVFANKVHLIYLIGS